MIKFTVSCLQIIWIQFELFCGSGEQLLPQRSRGLQDSIASHETSGSRCTIALVLFRALRYNTLVLSIAIGYNRLAPIVLWPILRYVDHPVNDELQQPHRPERARSRRPAAPRSGSRTGRLIQLAIAAVALILVVESLFGSRGLSAMLEARRQYQAVASDVERLRAENLRLRGEARRLREDPAAIEEAARRDLGYAAPGEKVFILRDARPAPTTPEPPAHK